MSLLERRFDDAGTAAAVVCRNGENVAAVAEASAWRRIRLGLTGLAAIFLIVLIAAASLRPAGPSAARDPQAEPLAVLGVAPGAAPAEEIAKAPPPAGRPSRT
jgi:hypothetical protein